LLSARAVDMSM